MKIKELTVATLMLFGLTSLALGGLDARSNEEALTHLLTSRSWEEVVQEKILENLSEVTLTQEGGEVVIRLQMTQKQQSFKPGPPQSQDTPQTIIARIRKDGSGRFEEPEITHIEAQAGLRPVFPQP